MSKSTEVSRPGRPLKYGEPLVRIQVLVRDDQREAAAKEAKKRGVSVSEVYRRWMDAGRKKNGINN